MPPKGHQNPLRLVTCMDCGMEFETRATVRLRCDLCKVIERRRRQRDYARLKTRGELDNRLLPTCMDCGVELSRPIGKGGRIVKGPKRCPEHQEANRLQVQTQASKRGRFRNYGITEDEYLALLKRQGGRCAICRADKPNIATKSWYIDHDHSCCQGPRSCGRCIRGLLCQACNTGIGYFRDQPDLLKAAMDYLHRDMVRQILNEPSRDEDGNLILE